MKIGAFAKHFQVNKTTVRFYTDINLLIPDSTGTYPNYNETCLKDMANIILYKSLGFTIEEIKEIKVLERFYVNLSDSNMKHIHDLMDKKITHHYKMIDEYRQQIKRIEVLKQSIDTSKIQQTMGVPFMSLSFLKCPICHESFDIENAQIKDNVIQEGSLKCRCGSNHNITDGIVYPKGFKPIDASRDKQLESIEYVNKLNNNHISVIKHTGTKLNKNLDKMDHSKGIIFANADTDILMMNLDQCFKENGFYFLCSYDINALLILKSKMERQEIKGHLTFIVYNKKVPLIKDIPYLIDNVGNLYDCVMKQEIGYGIQAFKNQAKFALEWYLIQMYTPSNSLSKVHETYQHYLNKNNYRDIYHQMGLTINLSEDVGEFEFIEGMIEHIKDVSSFKVEILVYKKK